MGLLASAIGHDLFTIGVPVADKVIRTVAVYLGLVLLLRVAGKRDLAQLNSFDLVVLLLLSNVVQNAVIGPDNSLLGGGIGAVVLLALNAGLVRLAVHSPRFTRMIEGTETRLVREGVTDHDAIVSLGMRDTDVLTAVRRQGASSVDEVEEAMLMPDGTITVTLRVQDTNATKGDLDRVEAKLDALLARLPGGPAPT